MTLFTSPTVNLLPDLLIIIHQIASMAPTMKPSTIALLRTPSVRLKHAPAKRRKREVERLYSAGGMGVELPVPEGLGEEKRGRLSRPRGFVGMRERAGRRRGAVVDGMRSEGMVVVVVVVISVVPEGGEMVSSASATWGGCC
jgi:hypothetical protein